MKNIIFIFILFLSIYIPAQTLHSDDKGVKVFYEIQQTEKFVLCEGNPYSDENFSTKKIFIWKVTFGIENGYSGSIVPRGVGIATISISPNPIKPYSHNYCNYKYLKNYEPNSIQRHLDQSLFVWSIRDHKVEEIKSGETIIATTYLYLYEGQAPKLTNWQFLDYRLKKDFKSYDPILNDIVNTKKSVTLLDKKTKDKAKILKVKSNNKINPIETSTLKIDKISIKEIEPVKDKVDEISVKTPKVISSDSVLIKEIKVTKDNESMADRNLIVVKKNQSAIDDKNRVEVAPMKCPGKKVQEYKEMSSNVTDIDEQKAYSWLILYYTYKCECETGSPRSDQLVPMINNVVDSYTTNTNDAFGKISKVTKCKPPTTNQ